VTDLTKCLPSPCTTGALPAINPSFGFIRLGVAGNQDLYSLVGGPTNFGSGGPNAIAANSSSGALVAIIGGLDQLEVPVGYSSGASLGTSSAMWDSASFSSLGVTPGTYVWNWGTGADADSFTLIAGAAAVPAPVIGRGLRVLLAVGGLLFGVKLLERGKRRGLQFG